MTTKTISIDDTLWSKARAKAKANAQSLSGVIRKLLLMWVSGDLEINQN